MIAAAQCVIRHLVSSEGAFKNARGPAAAERWSEASGELSVICSNELLPWTGVDLIRDSFSSSDSDRQIYSTIRYSMIIPMSHGPETGAINRLNFRRPVFVPYASAGMQISGALNKHG